MFIPIKALFEKKNTVTEEIEEIVVEVKLNTNLIESYHIKITENEESEHTIINLSNNETYMHIDNIKNFEYLLKKAGVKILENI